MTGKIIMDVAPISENRRNSPGDFFYLKNGDLLFAYTSFAAGGADQDSADICGMISKDDGETFGEPFTIITCKELGADTIGVASLMRMQNGDIGLFFFRKDEYDCTIHMIRSDDEGKTFKNPVLCSPEHGYTVINNDRVIRLKNGRILVPLAVSVNPVHGVRADGRGCICDAGAQTLFIYASDDDGYTFKPITEGVTPPLSRGLVIGVQEPGLLELKDGRLWCFIRNDSARQYECFSEDGGYTWSQPLPSPFTSPPSPLSAKYLSDGRIFVVWNPIPIYNGRREVGFVTGLRTRFAYALSCDDGETFSEPIVFEDDEESGFSYASIYETRDKSVLIAYHAGSGKDGTNLCRMRIRKFRLDELILDEEHYNPTW